MPKPPPDSRRPGSDLDADQERGPAFAEAVIDSVEALVAWSGDMVFGHNLANYCQFQTVIGDPQAQTEPDVIVTDGGSLLTYVSILGSTQIVSPRREHPSMQGLCDSMLRQLEPHLRRPGHSLHWMYERDPALTGRELRASMEGMVATAKRLKLDVMDVLQEQYEVLKGNVCYESSMLVLATHQSAMHPTERKIAVRELSQRFAKAGLPSARYAQNPFSHAYALLMRHRTFVERVIEDLEKQARLMVRRLSADEALAELGRMIDTELTPKGKRFDLPSAHARSVQAPRGRDASHLLPRALGYQLLRRDFEVDGQTVKIGASHFAGGALELAPADPETFMQLFERVDRDIGWRVVFHLMPQGNKLIGLRRTLTTFFGLMGDYNRQLRDAQNALDAHEKSGGTVVGLFVNFNTWGKSRQEAETNLARLASAFQLWGMSETCVQFGDPVEAVAAAWPGFARRNPANLFPMPLTEVVPMLPMARPRSPWAGGSVLYHGGGVLFPYQGSSSLQDLWATVSFAPPGSGKSFAQNTQRFGFFLAPGLEELPLAGSLDIGPSTRGLAQSLAQCAPEGQRHYFKYFRLQNVPEHAINPFDTSLGARFPTPMERMFCVAVLTTLCSDYDGAVGAWKTWPVADQLAAALVEATYRQVDAQPKRYGPAVEPRVDEALMQARIPIDEATTWWEVVDALFARDLVHEATLAQRHAVPSLQDVVRCLNSEEIRDQWGSVLAPIGGSLIEAMTLLLTSAYTAYPVFCSSTRLDIGDYRYLSLDLMDVAREGSPAEQKQAALFYLFGWNLLSRRIMTSSETVSYITRHCPEIYHEYHRQFARRNEQRPKSIDIDELHRTGGMPSVRRLFAVALREGRKFGLSMALLSQYDTDFDADMLDAATSVYVMKGPEGAARERLARQWEFSETALDRARQECMGPSPKGASFLVKFKTKAGNIEQILTNSAGSLTYWMFTTTQEDTRLQQTVVEMLGGDGALARRALARRFPRGAKAEIERRRALLGARSGEDADVFAQAAAEVVRLAGELRVDLRR